MSNKSKIYSPDKIYNKGFLASFRKVAKNIVNNRQLVWWLFLRDVKARYKQSLLGPAWVVVMPLVTMATFLLLNMSGVIKIKDIPVPYPIYGLLGISLWQLFANGLNLATGSIVNSSRIVGKTNISKDVFVIASICQTTVDFVVRILLLLLIYLLYLRLPNLLIIFLPLFVLPIFLFTLGLGFLTSILNIIFRDTVDFVRIGLNFLIFLIPVMYTFPEKGVLAVVNKYNPLFYLLQAPRNLAISGRIFYPWEFFLSSVLALLVFIIGWLAFYRAEPRLIEKL